MRRVILQFDVSLDGFTSAPDDSLDWVADDDVMNQDASDLLDTADTILLGRVAYQLFVEYWPTVDTSEPGINSRIADQLNRATKLVFSNTLDTAEWGEWGNARVVKGNVAEGIRRMKAQPGKNMLLYAGASLASTFIEHDLIDEYRLRVHPVVLGGGKPLFKGGDSLKLKLIESKAYQNGAVMLVYQP